MTSLVSMPNAIMTNIGEISNPPIGGIIRRTGPRMGSVKVVMIAVAGLCWPGEIQLIMILTIIANINRFKDKRTSFTKAVVAINEKLALDPTMRRTSKILMY